MKKNRQGVIYKVTNKKTFEVYIGITIHSMKERQNDHFKKTFSGKKSKFYNSIRTYGSDIFKWESDDTFYSTDELAQKEKELIKENKQKGLSLNMDSGGGIQKTVYKYSVQDLNLVEKFDCLEKAANTVNGSKQQISRACLNKVKYANFYWSYRLQVPFQPKKDNRLKEVTQYFPSSGETISVFKSVAEASRVTSINKNSIAKCCRGERKIAGGYAWKFNNKTIENGL